MSVDSTKLALFISVFLTLTFDFGLCRGAILETDRVTHQCTELAFHLLADSLRDRHGCHATGLRTADEAIGAVTVFVQELGELRCLP